MIENGKVTYPLKGATLIGNGPDALTRVSHVGSQSAIPPEAKETRVTAASACSAMRTAMRQAYTKKVRFPLASKFVILVINSSLALFRYAARQSSAGLLQSSNRGAI